MAKAEIDSTEPREIVPDVPEGLELGLRNYWYPVLQSEEIPNGQAWGLADRCPHRDAKLSAGRTRIMTSTRLAAG